jgi:putative membrane protein
MEYLDENKAAVMRKWIIAVSVAIPVAVGLLFKISIPGLDFSWLPAIYAGINGLTAVVLILALLAIKKKKIDNHRLLVRLALLLSILFLLMYVLYHMTSESTVFGDTNHSGDLDIVESTAVGSLRYVYYTILISHIGLSMVVIPLVLFSYLFAWQGDYVKHKKWTRFSFPIWLYVAITGVVVYFMIAPYYK